MRGLRVVADAGAELILLNPLSDESEQLDRIGAEILPRLARPDRRRPVDQQFRVRLPGADCHRAGPPGCGPVTVPGEGGRFQ